MKERKGRKEGGKEDEVLLKTAKSQRDHILKNL